MIKKFLDYVEIKTKITSLFAFLMTMAYISYIKSPINWRVTLVFFISMFIFDLVTTAINNYIDTKTNAQKLQFTRKNALAIIYILLGISITAGLYLVYLTDIVVLGLGALCFICGILYTFGPLPISRQPLGEIFSGIFYGFFIPFILLYINLPKGSLLTLSINLQKVILDVNVLPTFKVILLSVIPICTTANIMLANNICDVNKDIDTKRFTLPYYLGNKSLYLFAAIYYATYFDVVLMVILKVVSPICLLFLFTLIIVQKNIVRFFKLQDKARTFIVSIANYMIIMGTITLLIFISRFFG